MAALAITAFWRHAAPAKPGRSARSGDSPPNEAHVWSTELDVASDRLELLGRRLSDDERRH
jgi:hypothetical protein